jgi:hypothetical protein
VRGCDFEINFIKLKFDILKFIKDLFFENSPLIAWLPIESIMTMIELVYYVW